MPVNPKLLLKDFRKPRGINFEVDKQNPFYGRFTAAPFEHGFGVTIGNSLRRALLTSIPGYAITAVRLEYINSLGKQELLSQEFESIYGMYEDTVEFIQNLKRVRLRLLNELENRTIFIEKKGEGIFLAKELAVDDNVEVLNPELHLARFNEDAEIYLEVQVSHGRGYVPSERNLENVENVGTLTIDALFSPVKKVSYHVEKYRVGQRTDYDKVVLELWTDGTTTPDDALASAAKLLKDYFAYFVNFEEGEEIPEEIEDEEDRKKRELFEKTIEELELSVRSANCLRVANIRMVGELVQKSPDELEKIKNLGKRSIEEIQGRLESLGLCLGMKDVNYTQLKTNS